MVISIELWRVCIGCFNAHHAISESKKHAYRGDKEFSGTGKIILVMICTLLAIGCIERNPGPPTSRSSHTAKQPHSSIDTPTMAAGVTTGCPAHKTASVFSDQKDYRIYFSRLLTYRNWPLHKPTPTSLARSGLVYTGTSDVVKCPFCNMQIGHWEERSSPKDEHALLSPFCNFVLRQNGTDINTVVTSQNEADLQTLVRRHKTEQRNSSIRNRPGHENNSNIIRPDCKTREQAISTHTSRASALPRSASTIHFQNTPLLVGNRVNPQRIGQLEPESGSTLGSASDIPASRYTMQHAITTESTMQALLRPQSTLPRHAVGQTLGTNCSSAGSHHGGMQTPSGFRGIVQSRIRDTPNVVVRDLAPDSGRTEVAPHSPRYASYSNRLDTFYDWPGDKTQTPEHMADAGFVYVHDRDCVRCYFCNGGLQNWLSGDNAWTEHSRWFPRCEYIKRTQGPAFVLGVQNGRNPMPLSANISSQPVIRIPRINDQAHHRVDIGRYMMTPVALAAIEMGFTRSNVEKAIKDKVQDTGVMFETACEMIDILLPMSQSAAEQAANSMHNETEIEDSAVVTPSSTESSAGSSDIEDTADTSVKPCAESSFLNVPKTDCTQQTNTNHSGSSGGRRRRNRTRLQREGPLCEESLERKLRQLREENETIQKLNEQLEMSRTCRSCRNKQVSVLVLPCAHIVFCEDCVMRTTLCAHCNGPIQGTVKTYID